MDLTKYYPDIAAKYPAYVTQRELCEICHICPKTAYNLEQQGEIPYTIEQNHLIRSHKIKLTDILAYLYRRECRQEADSPYICAMRTFYDEHLSPYPDIPAVYVDTGLEYPELRDFVKTKDNVIWLRPRYPFTQILEKYGYPIISKEVSDVINGARKGQPYRLARLNGELLDKNGKKSIYNCENYKYLLDAPFKISARCCYHMKKAPLNKFERQSGRHPITGVLACESKLREQSWIKFGCNGFERQRPLSQPLAFWLEEDILRYLKMTGIPYAPIYGDIVESRKKNGTPILKTTGVSRSGCMYCMYGVHLEHEPNRFQLMQVTHPQQYDYCINKLGCGAVLDYIGVPYRNQQLEVDHC